jgi:hypothetical protein
MHLPAPLRQIACRLAFFPLALAAALLAILSAGCGSSGTASKPAPLSGITPVTVVLSSTANDQLSGFNVSLSALTLTSQSGKTVNLLTSSQSQEFIHVNGIAEPLVTAIVPQDIYTAATLTVSGYTGFVCVSVESAEVCRKASFRRTLARRA